MHKTALAFAAALFASASAQAALPIGTKAPDFSARAALAGKDYDFTLSRALKKGAVVLYFYPKAFTKGCTVEANMFADAAADFQKAGAMVVGVSGDDIATLKDFSTKECRDKFAVAGVTPQVIKSYDVMFRGAPNVSDRTSYVIAPNGRIVYVHSDLSPADHVKLTLAAVQQLNLKK